MPTTRDSLLYSRVETVLASEITDGDLKVGDQLPTEDSLITRFGVSRITVRRAIQNLVSRGLVEIRRGKGTFVVAPKVTQELKELSGFVEDMHALGRKPTARVIGKEIVTADATVARQLALTKGERVVRVRQAELDTELSLASLAKESGYSRAHFLRMFRAATRLTPHQYVLERRLSAAQQLLRQSKMLLVDIALQCGFSSQTHMNDVFRKRLGITPLEYRRNI